MKYFIIAKYRSKYGLILYAAKVNGEPESFVFDPDQCFISTLYFKGATEIKVNEFYDLQTIKGENGLLYAFL